MTERRAGADRRAWPRDTTRGRRRADREFYTPQEVGNLIGFSASFVVQEIKAHELPAVLIKLPGRKRGRWRIAVVDALAYAQRIRPTPI